MGKYCIGLKNGFCIDAANENDAYVKAKEIGLPIEDIIISEKKMDCDERECVYLSVEERKALDEAIGILKNLKYNTMVDVWKEKSDRLYHILSRI